MALIAALQVGCPKSNSDFQTGKKAEAVQDYDTALVYYERALREDPTNAEYKLRASQMRFEDGQFHIRQGRAAEQKGDLQRALIEFEKAQAVDPSSSIADQEVKRTLEKIAAQNAAEAPNAMNYNHRDHEWLVLLLDGELPARGLNLRRHRPHRSCAWLA